ncbi:GTP cyclohydrolase II [Palleronia sp. LCG004]|uniref:GTP cyclohydrolase II n=1 Tax=Palleronia sp. LCG004 TaxID=3079304 RepID=UPI00294323F8|nr:GTP cyclohydrolase II [Palleronia sp. LCG004]WOI55533.1 GTP cyclohydrolase II [Palleronia sp. LCG004]
MNSDDPFAPTLSERLSRATADLRIGLPIAIAGDRDCLLVIAAARGSDARLGAMVSAGGSELVLTQWRAQTLKIRVYDEDLVRLPLDPETPAGRIRALADPKDDLSNPMMGPFSPSRGGDVGPERAAIKLVRRAQILPAIVAVRVARPPAGVLTLTPEDVAASIPLSLAETVSASLPISASAKTRLHVMRTNSSDEEHYAVEIGNPDRTRPLLTRVHSACFTGDVLGSLKCDCGPQLDAALGQMAATGGGVLLYLNQEGRGIGLANKMRAYALQDQGFDTVEANHRLGFEDDERDFRIGATILKQMRIGRVRLLTNNPRKVAMLSENGIEVIERVPLWVGETAFNRDYLRIKTERSGHMK